MKFFSLKNPLFRIIFLILIFFIFVLIPSEIIEKRSLCIYFNSFGFICPGCGTTRACSNFFHLNFNKAIEYNEVISLTFLPCYVFFFVTEIIWFIYNKISKKQILSPLGYLIEFFKIKF